MGKKKFKQNDVVVVLSMTSSTIERPTMLFTVISRIDKDLIHTAALTPEGKLYYALRPDSCCIPAHVVKYIGEKPQKVTEKASFSEGTILTVKDVKEEIIELPGEDKIVRHYYSFFETGDKQFPKELFKDVEVTPIDINEYLNANDE